MMACQAGGDACGVQPEEKGCTPCGGCALRPALPRTRPSGDAWPLQPTTAAFREALFGARMEKPSCSMNLSERWLTDLLDAPNHKFQPQPAFPAPYHPASSRLCDPLPCGFLVIPCTHFKVSASMSMRMQGAGDNNSRQVVCAT